jgi:hypothetical protein
MLATNMKCQVSAATATGDTVKTLIDTLTVPATAKKIIGVWSYAVGAATLTSGEAVPGIIELESDDIALVPFQLPLECVVILTSGTTAFSPRVWNVSVPVNGGEKIRGYITMDMAQTGALKGRFGLIYAM